MPGIDTSEKRFESDIEAYFLSPAGGYTKCEDEYDPKLGLYKDTLIHFIKDSPPKAWQRFVNMNAVDPEKKFCVAFNNACDRMNSLGLSNNLPGKGRFNIPQPFHLVFSKSGDWNTRFS